MLCLPKTGSDEVVLVRSLSSSPSLLAKRTENYFHRHTSTSLSSLTCGCKKLFSNLKNLLVTLFYEVLELVRTYLGDINVSPCLISYKLCTRLARGTFEATPAALHHCAAHACTPSERFNNRLTVVSLQLPRSFHAQNAPFQILPPSIYVLPRRRRARARAPVLRLRL